ncbi:MAG: DUF362 domain-containing protein [bacterium]|nr:DUF362 domain-containing protein [bacterium]
MDRREFLKKLFTYTATAGTTLLLGGAEKLFSRDTNARGLQPDLVAVKGGEAEDMFDAGMKALGGMGSFVKKGQTVAVKPNIGWDVSPELGANTNPKLVGRIVKRCYEAGAKKVIVFDHTCNYWKNTYKSSAIEYYAKQEKAQMAPAHLEGYYQNVTVPDGKELKQAKVHEAILSSDVFINVPVLKDHGSARLTSSMKNLMGIVWDRGYWHRNDLHQCIADFAACRKPDLNVVDAYRVMLGNGPRGVSASDVTLMKTQIISRDMVAADTAAAKVFGVEPSGIEYIRIAAARKLGEMDLNKLNIERITL